MWELSPVAEVTHRSFQPMEKTTYPSLGITAMVARRQGYYIFNVVLPLGSLQLLAAFQFLLPGSYIRVVDRIAFSSTLLLTSAAYKLFVSSSLPDISYLTLIDRYVLLNFFSQTGMILPSLGLGYFRRSELPVAPMACLSPCDQADSYLSTGELIDLGLMLFFIAWWFLVHGWIASRYMSLRRIKQDALERHAIDCVEVGETVEQARLSSAATQEASRSATAYREAMNHSFTSGKTRSRAQAQEVQRRVSELLAPGVVLDA